MKKDKKYVVYCAPELAKVKGIIKVALKKVPKDSKLVVVCLNHTDEEKNMANENEYTLITLNKIKEYGTEMIDAKSRETV
jgi:phosphoglycerate dehydrogenase-like enzyme